MKKYYFALLMLTVSVAFIIGAQVLTSCKFVVPELAQTECVEFIFPDWTIESSTTTDDTSASDETNAQLTSILPEFSRWKVEVCTPDGTTTSFITDSLIQLELKKNVPAAIVATPIVLNSENQEFVFFKPCGTIYPYEYDAETKTQTLSWECGFAATLFINLFESKNETGITAEHMENFLQHVNWKKLIETIKTNAQEDSSYNPWLTDKTSILENLSYKNFKASLLNQKNVAQLSFSTLGLAQDEAQNDVFLSAYIPENASISQSKKICIKKTEVNFFNYKTDYAAIITYTSAKNISLEYVYMPIFKQ